MIKRSLLAVLALVALLGATAYVLATASLPRRAGEARVPGLAKPVTVELDARAIPRLRGGSLLDALRAQGYMHAQERYFQMDILRRAAAGELAAVLGERALPADLGRRPYEFRRRALATLAELPAEQRSALQAYVDGVNGGLEDLGARPPEYWLLGARPTPWRPEDSLLVVFTFYTSLSNNDSFELPQLVMHAALPPALYDFLTPSSSRFDRPLTATAEDPTAGYVPAPIPGPEIVDLRNASERPPSPALHVDPPLLGPASNQWAVDATRGARGRALLANDPHLGLNVPNVFYRAELEWPGGAVRGVSIPGAPGILIGANDRLAWGATVSNVDQADWVVIDVDPDDSTRYLTPDGSQPFATTTASVAVAGRATPETIELRTTRFGPIVGSDWRGRPLALHATWLEPHGLDLTILSLATAGSVDDGVAVLERWSGPSLNWALADDAGHIGWVVNGPIPERIGFDGSRPVSWADGSRRWAGYAASPQLHGHASGALYTANNRTLALPEADSLSRVWMRPLRAKRIADLLATTRDLDERRSLAMQLDTRAEGYEQLRDAFVGAVRADEADPALAAARAALARWNGQADPDQVGMRLLQVLYRALLERALTPLLGAAVDADPGFVYRWPLADEVLRRLLDERPPHLLTHEYADWDAFLRAVLRDSLAAIERDAEAPGREATWGDVNRLDIAHPFAAQTPLAPLARWLAWPHSPLPGSMVSLRVATPRYGAVIRFAVSPGDPANGVLELAGGQSGHFLSPQFRDELDDWIQGAPTPFLAGATQSSFVLTPN